MTKRLIPHGKIIRARSPRNGNRGSILIACLIILSILAVYGAVLVSVVYERSLGVSLFMERTEALYLAEAGLAKAIYEVKSLADADGDGIGTIPKTPFGGGFYSASHDPANLSITAVGMVNEVERKVRIQYSGV